MDILKISLTMIFNPTEAFEYMKKDRSKFSYFPIIIILFLVILVRSASIYITHFPLAKVDPRTANLFLEMTRVLLPIITWVIASYAMTTILDGETLLREALLATTYAMIPYIVLTIPLNVLSIIMEKSQEKLYFGMSYAIIGWIIYLFILSVKTMNQYSIGKTIVICLLAIFTMFVIWATIALFFAISSQFLNFLGEVMIEIRMKLME
jgi:hypothetical protein